MVSLFLFAQHQPDAARGAWMLFGLALIAMVSVAIYILPIMISQLRGHPNAFPILLLTLLGGWTCIGWVAALVWSVTSIGDDS